ncbi:MAG: hypothetical protein ACK5RW_02170, partial [bacterium]
PLTMQPEAISAVRWALSPGTGKGAAEAPLQPASSLTGSGAHLILSVPSVRDPSVQASLSVRSIGESFSHGMRSSFTAQPMADMVAATKKGDIAAMTVALVRVTDAANSAHLLTKMASQVNNGIKTLTSQSG